MKQRERKLNLSHASEPKEIHLYPGCRHGLDECRDQVDAGLLDWLRRLFGKRGISA